MSISSINMISVPNPATGTTPLPRVPYAVNCSLCGCTGASVRCAKCNSMAFCIGCDDMYHRHPKRRTHLRQAVALEFIQVLERHHQEEQRQKKQNPMSDNNINDDCGSTQTKVLYPWRISRTVPRKPETFWAHPSKMPIPPPRRKKKTLSFAGIKDTFKRLVNPHQQQPQTPIITGNQQQYDQPPVYATINHSGKSIINKTPNQQAFRPLPPTPTSPIVAGQSMYENMRKFSLQECRPEDRSRNWMMSDKSKAYASTHELTTMRNNNHGNMNNCPSSYETQQISNKKSKCSSLPRKNFSYQELYNNHNQPQQPQYHGTMFPGQCLHGSSQSIYPGMMAQQSMISPQPPFFNHCNHHCGFNSNWCGPYTVDHNNNYYYNHNSMSNSLEELGMNHSHDNSTSFDSFDLTDDEEEEEENPLDCNCKTISRNAKNRLRRAKMKRSQSTFTMYGNNIDESYNLPHQANYGTDFFGPNQSPYQIQGNTRANGKSDRNPKLNPSPTLSVKSNKILDHSNRSLADVSDSSSSSCSNRKNSSIKNAKNDSGVDVEPNDETETVNVLGNWYCRFCTFLNDPTTNICEVCSKTRSNIRKLMIVGQKTSKKVSIDPVMNDTEKFEESCDKVQPTESIDQHGMVFDESFIREQIEIENELRRRRENQLRIDEENRKLEESTKTGDHPKPQTSSADDGDPLKTDCKTNAAKDDREEIGLATNAKNNNQNDNGLKLDDIDRQEKIVAKIIEEKITQQFEKLKLQASSQSSVEKLDLEIEAKQPTKTISPTPVESAIDSSTINANVPVTAKSEVQYPVFNQVSANDEYNNQPFQPPNGFRDNNSMIFQQQQWQNNGNFISSSGQQQSNHILGQHHPNRYPRQRSLSSCSNDSSMNMFNSVVGGYVNLPQPYYSNDTGRTSIVSFDDLQSMSSVTSASLFSADKSSMMANSGRQMIQVLREAEKKGYTADDLEVALQFSPRAPLEWLQENWKNLCEIVMTMSNNQIVELERNNGNNDLNFLIVTEKDAKIALRLCKGNVWQSVERCVRRHQDTKAFGKKESQSQPSKSRSFSLKIMGAGSGSANMDGNHFKQNHIDDDEDYDYYLAKAVEDAIKSSRTKMMVEKQCSALQESMESKNNLLGYLEKIKQSKNLNKLNPNDLEESIAIWQQEQAIINDERERLKSAEKKKQNMQKMINVPKRISSGGGYLSDGTTTEEELDREVARVFQKKSSIQFPEMVDLDQTPTFTEDEDISQIHAIPGPSGIQFSKSNSNDDPNKELNQIKQRIGSKLNELTMKSNTGKKLNNFQSDPDASDRNQSTTPVNQLPFGSDVSPISISDTSEHYTDAISDYPNASPWNPDANKTQPVAIIAPIEAKIIRDDKSKIEFKTEFSEHVHTVQKSYLSKPVKIYTPKLQPDRCIVENVVSFETVAGQVNQNKILEPMFARNPVPLKATNNDSKSSPVKHEIAGAKPPALEESKKKSKDRSRPKLSYSSKSLSLSETPSSTLAVVSQEDPSTILQKPVFSKLRGLDRMQKARLLSSENDLIKLNDEDRTLNQKKNKSTIFKLCKSESIESYLHDRTPLEQSSASKERARRLIVDKLKSVESLNKSNTSVYVTDFAQPTRLITKFASSNSVESLKSAKSEPDTIARDEYSYDFQWARTELECELCARTIPVPDIVVMITCTHYACRECMKRYLTVQIRERQRLVITCPFCDQPDISADHDEQVFEYLGIFDPFVRHIIDADVYELYQRKVRDRALMRDPNFLWCIQCSSGFIVPNPRALAVICPDCKCVFCRSCKKLWKNQHLDLSCENYAKWEMQNDLDYAEQQLNKHLKEFGIECPNCHFRYQLAKGGCMHFRCTQCSFDFCGGCSRPFKLGSRCFRAKVCERLGLHAHHPRNCLFYLRDKDVKDLQKLLEQHKIEFKTTMENGDPSTSTTNRCQVMEQKEVDFVMKDRACNHLIDTAGLCKMHYKEYLGNLIYQNKIDPIPVFTESELELTLKRENIRIPTKIRGQDYRAKLMELIVEKIPLDLKQ